MDAERYIIEMKRMCDSYLGCIGCPIRAKKDNSDIDCSDFISTYPKEAVKIVEEWSKEYPIMTNAMKFKEVFGCEPYETMTIRYCPPIAYRTSKCMRNCEECKVWWDEGWKEPEND